MKKRIIFLILPIFVLYNCSSTKKLETTAPFTLGETYAQKWKVENDPSEHGYEVIIPIVSLNNDDAVLKNLYHKGKMTALEMRLTEMGNVAIAEYGADKALNTPDNGDLTKIDKKPFPFVLTETQAVISYVNNEKVKYYKINGIRQNMTVSYATALAKKER